MTDDDFTDDDFTDDDLDDLPSTWLEPLVRPFVLVRHEDLTGTSGTGVVAEGAVFSDGTVVIRWCCPPASSTTVFASVNDLVTIHGHNGATELHWLDGEVDPDRTRRVAEAGA